MLVVGMTCSGKTRFILDIFEDYKNHFDNIILICPTFDYNMTYQDWKYISDRDVIKDM